MRSGPATICPGWASRAGQDLQLVPGQLHRLAPQGGGAPGEVEGEGPGGEGVRLAPLPRPAEDRLDPGQEDGDVVGFGDVVVAPQAEGLQLVQGGVPAGDDDDGHRALPPQGGAQGEAVLAGEAQVQQHQVRPEGLDLPGGRR